VRAFGSESLDDTDPDHTQPGTATPSPGTTTPTCADLVNQAEQDYSAAQDRLKAKDLAGYAADIQKLGDVLQQMQAAGCANGAGGASPGPSPSPSPGG
jgi:hypothetical protein